MSASSETLATAVSKAKPSRAALIFAVLCTWIIWGSTYLAIRISVDTAPPLVTAGFRLLVAGAILFGYSYYRGFRPTLKHWWGALVVGALYFLGSHGLLYFAEERVASGLAAVIMATEPMVISLILVLTRKERFSVWTMLGLACGIGGVAYLMGGQMLAEHSQMIGITALLVGSVLWAIGVCYSPYSGLTKEPFASAAMTMLTGAVLLLITAGVLGEYGPGKLDHVSTRSLLALGFLIVFGSLVAFSAYIWLLTHVSPTLVSTHTFVNPVVAVVLGWAVAGEPMSARLVVAMLAILGSIAFIRMGTRATDRR